MIDKGSFNVAKAVVLDNPVGVTLNFSEISILSTKSQEIRNSILTGNHTKYHVIRPANIVLSKVFELKSQAGLFEYVDIKDSYVEQSIFKGCSFDYGAIINCEFHSSEFSECHFYNVSITGTVFRNVTFIDSKLDHMVIEDCKFFNCHFINCTTSNKLFEYCLFIGCQFKQINLQIQTLINCFGITVSDLRDSRIRDRSIDEEFRILDKDEIQSYPVSTPIEAFNIAYFLDPNCLNEGSEDFDITFELESWVGTAKIPLTFTNLLSLYAEFLIGLYEDQKIVLFPLLKLHSLTGALVQNANIPTSSMSAIYGVHMVLARYSERFIDTVRVMINQLDHSADILVTGPLDKNYYLEEFAFIFAINDLQITKIKKYNSPNEVSIVWQSFSSIVPFVAVFFASRLKFEVREVVDNLPLGAGEEQDSHVLISDKATVNVLAKSIFEVQIGFDDTDKHLYGMKLKSIFPGNLLMELGLHVSTKKVAAVRDLIIKILT